MKKLSDAQFRFFVLGELLHKSFEPGGVTQKVKELSQREWFHPEKPGVFKISERTLWQWYKAAKKNPHDRLAHLGRKTRSDKGKTWAVRPEHYDWLKNSYKVWPSWSWKLHADNLVRVPGLDPFPSYSSLVRFMKKMGMIPERKFGNGVRPPPNTLGFEARVPAELWHFDGHDGSRKVLLETGEYVKPKCIAFIDDRSRYVIHCQWVFTESAEELIHTFKQAVLKGGLPEKVMSDNGSGMVSGEFTTGLQNLGIKQIFTKKRSPYQNGKIETFWRPLESRLMQMLSREKVLTLESLNQYTQAWVNQEYNKKVHEETRKVPEDFYFECEETLARKSPDYNTLTRKLRQQITRKVHQGHGTISVDGVRYQVPTAFRHLQTLRIATARFERRMVTLIDSETGKEICDLFPQDKERNFELKSVDFNKELKKESSVAELCQDDIDPALPPLLQHLLKQERLGSISSGYIPFTRKKEENVDV